jgi:predicted DNA-binding transcriptional regulator AlpA
MIADSGAQDLGAEVGALRALVEALARKVEALCASRSASRLKLAGVLELTALSEATINRRCRDGGFPVPEGWIGRERVWRRADVEEWIAQQATAPRPQRQRIGVAAWSRDQHVAREEAKNARRKGGRLS